MNDAAWFVLGILGVIFLLGVVSLLLALGPWLVLAGLALSLWGWNEHRHDSPNGE